MEATGIIGITGVMCGFSWGQGHMGIAGSPKYVKSWPCGLFKRGFGPLPHLNPKPRFRYQAVCSPLMDVEANPADVPKTLSETRKGPT